LQSWAKDTLLRCEDEREDERAAFPTAPSARTVAAAAGNPGARTALEAPVRQGPTGRPLEGVAAAPPASELQDLAEVGGVDLTKASEEHGLRPNMWTSAEPVEFLLLAGESVAVRIATSWAGLTGLLPRGIVH